jgi:outer membrane protein OmpA-like peptidoglycan-associated protein
MNRLTIAGVVLAGLVVGACAHRAGTNQAGGGGNAAPAPAIAAGGVTQGSIGVANTIAQPLVVVPTTLVPPELDIPGISSKLSIKNCILTITLQTGSVGFAFDSAAISDSGEQIVAAVATAMAGARQVDITGYSSSEGQYEYNVQLSLARAQTVESILESLLPGAGFSVLGRGPNDPVAPNDSESGRSQNRRVVISAQVQRSQCEK